MLPLAAYRPEGPDAAAIILFHAQTGVRTKLMLLHSTVADSWLRNYG